MTETKLIRNGAAKDIALRDYFAGQIASGDAASGEDSWDSDISDARLIARAAFYYRLADAMLKARGGK